MLILIFNQPSIFSYIGLDFEYEGTHFKKSLFCHTFALKRPQMNSRFEISTHFEIFKQPL